MLNCSDRCDKRPGLSFHGLPANEDLMKSWSVAIKLNVVQHFRVSRLQLFADFSTGARQGSDEIKLNSDAVSFMFAVI